MQNPYTALKGGFYFSGIAFFDLFLSTDDVANKVPVRSGPGWPGPGPGGGGPI